jgi:hypothetical protein
MARSPEELARRNAAAKKSYHLNHHANLKRRFMQRIASGKTTRVGKASLDKFGMTIEDVNEIRRCNGLGDLRSPLDPAPPCRSPNSPMDVDHGPGGPQSHGTHDHEAGPSSANEPEASPGDEGSRQPMSVNELVTKMLAMIGKPQLTPAGHIRKKDGVVVTLAKSTMTQNAGNVRRFFEDLGCLNDVTECFQDYDRFLQLIRGKWSEENTRKTYIGAIVNAAKYVPEFRDGLGPAFEHIRQAMLGHIGAAELAQIAKSGTARVVPFDKLMEKLPAVK